MMRLLMLSALSGLLLGCAAEQAAPATFLLDVPAPDTEPPSPGRSLQNRPVLLLAPPVADAAVDTIGIAYSSAPLALSYYRDSRWADTPPRMLEPVLARALDASGQFRAVLTQPSTAAADYTLNVTLLTLRQEFTSTPSRVRLALRVSVSDNVSSRVIAARRFETIATAPSEDAYGGVRAAAAALQTLLQEVIAFLRATQHEAS